MQDASDSSWCGLSAARCLSRIHRHPPAMDAGLCGGGSGRQRPRKCNLLCVSISPPFPNKEQLGENLYPKCRFINTPHQESQGQGLKLSFIHHLLI